MRRADLTIVLLVGACLLLWPSPALPCSAVPGVPLLLIDGTDAGSDVNFLCLNATPYPLYVSDGLSADLLCAPGDSLSQTYPGGTVLDLVLMAVPGGMRLSEGCATMDFEGYIAPCQARHPTRTEAYWRTALITWDLPGDPLTIQTLMSGDGKDGLAAVPLPPSLVLFGSGLLLLWRRRAR